MHQTFENFPFLTVGQYLEQDYVGIIGNSDQQIVSMYVYNSLPNEEMKRLFIQLGEEWWWESNRQIPINIFLKDRWTIFRPYLKTFIAKDFQILHGPSTSLDDLMTKRIKRRQISLIKKL